MVPFVVNLRGETRISMCEGTEQSSNHANVQNFLAVQLNYLYMDKNYASVLVN